MCNSSVLRTAQTRDTVQCFHHLLRSWPPAWWAGDTNSIRWRLVPVPVLLLAPCYVTRHGGIAAARGELGVRQSRAQGAAGPHSCTMAWESGTLPRGTERSSGPGPGPAGLAHCWITAWRKRHRSLPLNSLLQCFEPEPVQSTWCCGFVRFCLRQFWISHSLVNSNHFNTFTNTKN